MKISATENRSIGLDFMKYICSFMVICIHSVYVGKEYIEPMTRVAVPLFFMISGYYYSQSEKKGRTRQQIRKILYLFALSSGLYIVWRVISQLLTGRSVIQLLASWFSANELISFLVFNEPPYKSHLWYLMALLYVLVLVEVFRMRIDREKVAFLIPVLFCINFVLGNYSVLFLRTQLPITFSRNYLFMGLPCFLLGDYIYKHRDKTASPKKLLFALCVSVILVYAERSFLIHNEAYGNQDVFIGTIFMAYTIFQLARQDFPFFHKRIVQNIASCGKDLTTSIYIIHPIILQVISVLTEYLGTHIRAAEDLYLYLSPIIVLFLSTIASAILLQIRIRLRIAAQEKSAQEN